MSDYGHPHYLGGYKALLEASYDLDLQEVTHLE